MAQTPDEKTYVEIPFIEHLKGIGWDHIEGDIDVPYLTERESFRDVLPTGKLRKAIKKSNLDECMRICGPKNLRVIETLQREADVFKRFKKRF